MQPSTNHLPLRRLVSAWHWRLIWRPRFTRWSLRFVKAQEKLVPTVALVEQGTEVPELVP